MGESLYGPSPSFLKAVRWFSRGLSLFMMIGVIAAIAYAVDMRSENQKLLEEKKSRQSSGGDDDLSLASTRRAELGGLRSERDQLRSKIERLERENQTLQQRAATSSSDPLAFLKIQDEADIARFEADRLSAQVALLQRKIEILEGERVALQEQVAMYARGDTGHEIVTGGGDFEKKLALTTHELVEDESNLSARLAVIDQLQTQSDAYCVKWLRDDSTVLSLETRLLLIEALQPEGGDALLVELYQEGENARQAWQFLDALSGYQSADANLVRMGVLDANTNDIQTRIRALNELAFAGEKRAAGFVRLLYKETQAGDDLRLLLIQLPGATGNAAFATAAEFSLYATDATPEERAAARESYRKLGREGLEKVRNLYQARHAYQLSEAQGEMIKATLDELERVIN